MLAKVAFSRAVWVWVVASICCSRVSQRVMSLSTLATMRCCSGRGESGIKVFFILPTFRLG